LTIARRSRRGLTVLVVLLLLAITLGLTYAVVRSQTTALQIQQNANLRASARLAALTGLTMALKEMHTDQWCNGSGVDTKLSGSLGDHQRYEVSYSIGDPSLSSDDPDYPCRVTLLSAGTATDPGDPSRTTSCQARAVVRLAPRNLAEEPTDWRRMQRYTLYQTKRDPFEIDIPCQLAGPVRAQGKLRIALHYPNNNNAWLRYLDDLNDMRLAGLPDYRPLTGPVDLLCVEQDGKDLAALLWQLHVTVNDTLPREAASDWTNFTSPGSYQIFPGGPVYTIPPVGTPLENTTLEPDPKTNPLGLYYRDGSITIRDNVTVRGSLFCRDDLTIEGINVHFKPVELPALWGTDAPVRLAAASCRKFIVKSSGEGSLTGLLAVFDEFRVDKSPDTVTFRIVGRVITRRFYIKERQPWETLDWSGYYDDFADQLEGDEGPVVKYFPVWMGYQGRDPEPLLTVKPDPAPVEYHWKNPYDPVYVPHPDDDGLRWEVLQWSDNP
jgi:hypothetical protein